MQGADKSFIGGKAFHLNYLKQRGFNVPDGIIVTQEWFEYKDEQAIFDALDPVKKYAVRSSASDEDSADYSFAGLQDTYLNVPYDEIIENVFACFQSQWSERATAYRDQHNIGASTGMTVVIQEMVAADYAGVMFTQHPVSNRIDQVVIEVVAGLGEALVSGQITPSSYTVNKASDEIDEQNLHGTVIRPMVLKKLVQVAGEIEDLYKTPQDIEYAIVDDHIYVLQSRPITTGIKVPKPIKEGLRFYVSFGHIQNMTYPMTPVGAEMIQAILNFTGGDEFSDIVLYNGEHLFVDITDGLLVPGPMFQRVALAIGNINHRLPELAKTFRKMTPKRRLPSPKLIKLMATFLYRIYRTQKQKNHSIEPFVESLEAHVKSYKEMSSIDVLLEEQKHILIPLFNKGVEFMGTGMLAYLNTQRLFKKYGLNQEDFLKLLAGLEGNVTTEMGLLYDDLLLAYGTPEGDVLLSAYIDKYGMRVDGEIDIGRMRPYEDLEAFRRQVKNDVDHHDGQSARARHHRMKEESRIILTNIAQQINTKRWVKLKKWIDLMQTYMVIREHPKYAIVRIFRKYKSYIDNPFITLREQYRDGYDLDTIEARKMTYRAAEKKQPPLVMLSNGMILKSQTELDTSAVKGLGVSAGIVKGRVRVIEKLGDDFLLEGEILVTHFTDPGWTTVMAKAAGFIIEVGGMMTHGAVVAREYGVPAIVSVERATEVYKTGDWIEMNGETGEIKLVKE